MIGIINLDLLNIVTFLWLGFWALRAVIYIAAGNQSSMLFVILIHFVFSGLPLLLDVLLGKPALSIFRGLYWATRDDTTSIIYCLYVSAVPVFWWWHGKINQGLNVSGESSDITIDNDPASFLSIRKLALYVFMLIFLISPLLAWISSPNPQVYLNYGVTVNNLFRFKAEEEYHNIISITCFLNLIGATGLIALQKRINILLIFSLLPWIFLAIWLNGKRHLVVFAIVLIGYIIWYKGYLKGVRFIIALMVAVLIVSIFSSSYQTGVRGGASDFEEVYEGFRVDYGRDSNIKMAIFAELYPQELQILEYRGQSIFFYFTMYIPRQSWPEKPMPYRHYVTSAAFMIPPKLWTWGLTTSFLEEAIANFSWFGMILGPSLISIICRVGDSRSNPLISPLTVLIAILFLAVDLSAFSPLFLIWLMMIFFVRPTKRIYPHR